MKRERALERALVFNFLIHGLGLVAMVTLLLALLPGGTTHEDAERIARIAARPWHFRFGWLPWQLCAVADLWLAVAMLRTPWLSRGGASAVLVLTVCAVIPDQYAALSLHTADVPQLAGAWAECFTNWRGFLAYCVPLIGEAHSQAASALTGDQSPLCFYVPRVSFALTEEARARDLRMTRCAQSPQQSRATLRS